MTDDARARALEAIDQDPVLRALLERVRPLLADDDPGHDLEHCLRVAGWTLRCGADPREGVAAALLHDVVNLPKNDPRRKEASALSATKARELLGALDLALADQRDAPQPVVQRIGAVGAGIGFKAFVSQPAVNAALGTESIT